MCGATKSDCSSRGWPSQLERVDSFLQQYTDRIRVNVQKLSGAEPLSIEIETKATLEDLKAMILRTSEAHIPGVSLCLLLGERLLKDEFDSQRLRWKSLTEYGIAHGETLCMIRQEQAPNGMINIALQEWHGIHPLAIEIDSTATLSELEEVVFQQSYHAPGRKLSFSFPGGTPFRRGLGLEKTLAEHGIEDGKTLVWRALERRERQPLSDITSCLASNENARCDDFVDPHNRSPWISSVLAAADNSNWLQQAESIGHFHQQVEDCQQPFCPKGTLEMAAPHTPTRNTRRPLERASSDCKASKSHEARAKKMLKRL